VPKKRVLLTELDICPLKCRRHKVVQFVMDIYTGLQSKKESFVSEGVVVTCVILTLNDASIKCGCEVNVYSKTEMITVTRHGSRHCHSNRCWALRLRSLYSVTKRNETKTKMKENSVSWLFIALQRVVWRSSKNRDLYSGGPRSESRL
jgi:hypothetical protein